MQQIKGFAGSQGSVTDIARVLLDINEIGKFEAGNILVTVSTSPQWTPIMRLASAIVTDIGGSLSHAAIVSREFGIPAVVGTKKATKTIKDGQKITVDGSKGIVYLS
ncbi:hypothetical protein KKC62_03970 [Patescibacteria group bacterium]|nr:hypothetical protein [Patescibacteria group bacterium]MBU1953332.1 hypothetical protein [Patescibacteria group bacterium]